MNASKRPSSKQSPATERKATAPVRMGMTRPSLFTAGDEMRSLFVGGLLAALALVAYLPVYSAGYIWDDDFYILRNRTLTNPDGLRQIWFEPRATPQYYPLVHSAFRIEHRLWGDH